LFDVLDIPASNSAKWYTYLEHSTAIATTVLRITGTLKKYPNWQQYSLVMLTSLTRGVAVLA
jgi:hypothetical protein